MVYAEGEILYFPAGLGSTFSSCFIEAFVLHRWTWFRVSLFMSGLKVCSALAWKSREVEVTSREVIHRVRGRQQAQPSSPLFLAHAPGLPGTQGARVSGLDVSLCEIRRWGMTPLAKIE